MKLKNMETVTFKHKKKNISTHTHTDILLNGVSIGYFMYAPTILSENKKGKYFLELTKPQKTHKYISLYNLNKKEVLEHIEKYYLINK